ncbi:tellurite resistance protein [Luteibacter sp. UNCMF331Sha3.1]|uniref:dicarboxylate transporter/tellurite-resistance protein TehA n=1 Tax=Luteibacter sp. UNCMF331Sha3.1 TaxID=1502760 RepID=UPI0008ABB722|nr:dicarboxylate transporter/tellurite-resistance protein TehA [Luteibacter sp. UNCMF331Sha3.1]SEN22485.1 tellurite resistance protein [Luteibacter sp. UNCMF331Sha3.1]
MTQPVRTVPAGFFGMILGLVGLGSSWRVAARLWGLPPDIGEAIMAVAFVVWLILTAAFWYKWIAHRAAALEEIHHPINCCFVGLAPSSTVLMAVVLAPHFHALAVIALIGGAIGQVAFGVWRFGGMLEGDRDVSTTTPVIYLPSVAGNFIIAIGAGTLGFTSWGILFFGVGLFSWFALESIVVFRLLNVASLAPPLRPTIGIQLAPPVVAVVAFLANTQGHPELLTQAAWGYGLVQLLLVLRLFFWITKQPFAPSYWAFSFGITALSTGALAMTERGVTGAIAQMAPVVFVFTNVVMAVLIVGTLVRIAQGKLLPSPPPAAAASPA